VRRASQAETIQRVLGLILMTAGAILILSALPLWFWLGVLGAACVAAGWMLVANWR